VNNSGWPLWLAMAISLSSHVATGTASGQRWDTVVVVRE
jgi:hypothetical protein